MTTITADSTVTSDSSAVTADGLTSLLGGALALPVNPDNQLDLEHEPKVTAAKFGDGYEQRVAKGLNNDLQAWDVRYDIKNKATADLVFNFLKARGGVEAFSWIPPGETEARLFVARKYRKSLPYGVDSIQTITSRFEEVPA